MRMNQWSVCVLVAFLMSGTANADQRDILQGKFAFNWAAEPSREKCVKVEGALLATFKSTKYKCDLNVRTNTASEAAARSCTEVKGHKEFLIFDTMRACETERKTQATNE